MARPRLSDRLKGKSGHELINEIKKEFENDKRTWFDSDGPRLRLFRNRKEGFPFDEDVFNAKSDPEIKSYFEDLTKKHPQFSSDLHCPPWSGSTDRDWERAYTVPISVEPSETVGTVGTAGASSSQSQSPGIRSQPDPSESLSQPTLRHTVDIAEQIEKNNLQKLENEPKRSSSAPPGPSFEGGKEPKRFTTKIEFTPVNPFEPKSNMTSSDENDVIPPVSHDDRTYSGPREVPITTEPRPCNQNTGQSTQPIAEDTFARNEPLQPGECHTNRNQPQVRHIPIFVEGRTEPVVPANVEASSEKKNTADQAPLKRKLDGSSANGGVTTEVSPQFDQNHESSQEFPLETQVTSASVSQSASAPSTSVPFSASASTSPAPVTKLDSQQRIEQVQQEVDLLTRHVEQYCGTSRTDKEYLYLDEMLTRNLIKLDTIEVEGNEQLRTARKNVIKSIQKSIGLLESKIPLPSNENTSGDDSLEQVEEPQVTSDVSSMSCGNPIERDSNKVTNGNENDETKF